MLSPLHGGQWAQKLKPQGYNMCQAAASATAGQEMDCDSVFAGVLRPSRRIMYDAHEALVCFLSDEVEGCMDEFKEGWESVSKIVVIAHEGMSASHSSAYASAKHHFD